MNARWCISTPPPGFVVIGNLTVSGHIVIPYFILCYTVIRHFAPNADPGGQLKHNLMNLTSVRQPLLIVSCLRNGTELLISSV